MRLLRALIGISAPPEARFFLAVGGFAVVVDVVYWFVSYEDAGTLLLGGFALAALLMGTRLAANAESRRAHRPLPPFAGPTVGPDGSAAEDPQRPFLDESGRMPAPTFAPFALGIGVAIAATSLVFGPAPLLVGAIPLAWGALRWLGGARDELTALEAAEARETGPDGAGRSRPAPGEAAEGPTHRTTSAGPLQGGPVPSPSAPLRDPP